MSGRGTQHGEYDSVATTDPSDDHPVGESTSTRIAISTHPSLPHGAMPTVRTSFSHTEEDKSDSSHGEDDQEGSTVVGSGGQRRTRDRDHAGVDVDLDLEPLSGSPSTFSLLEHNGTVAAEAVDSTMGRVMALFNRHPWLPFAFMFMLMALSGGVFWVYHKPILEWLEHIGLKIRETGLIGAVIMTLFIFTTAFPPMMGYSTSVTLSGFAYGFPLGFLPAFIGALTGAIACFMLCRRYGKHHIQWVFNWNPHITAAVKAIEKKGFKLLLLIRISPYPFTIINALLSGTNITLKSYSIATAISLLKLITHVYVGANLTSFSNHLFERMAGWQVVLMLLGFGVGLGVMVYVYRLTQRAIDSLAEIPPDSPDDSTTIGGPDGFGDISSPVLRQHTTPLDSPERMHINSTNNNQHQYPPSSTNNHLPATRPSGVRLSSNSWVWDGSDDESEVSLGNKVVGSKRTV